MTVILPTRHLRKYKPEAPYDTFFCSKKCWNTITLFQCWNKTLQFESNIFNRVLQGLCLHY